MAFQLIQAVYWLALSTWFGSVVFLGLAAGAVAQGIREQTPVLPHVLAVNLEDQHGVLLGSSIMSHLLNSMGKLQMGCAVLVLAGCALQFRVADVRESNAQVAWLRVALAVAAYVVLAVDRFILLPRINHHRETYIEHADEVEIANAAKEGFDYEQQHSMWLLFASFCLLAGLVLLSASILPALQTMPAVGGR